MHSYRSVFARCVTLLEELVQNIFNKILIPIPHAEGRSLFELYNYDYTHVYYNTPSLIPSYINRFGNDEHHKYITKIWFNLHLRYSK